MNILLATSELEPFTGTGDLSGAVHALSAALAARGHAVSVVLPWYRAARENGAAKAKRLGLKFTVPVGGARFPVAIRETKTAAGVQVYFIERDEFFDRSGLYGTDEGDYQDNAARFIYFARAVVELAQRLDPAPEILHAHNWQAALVPVFAAEQHLAARTVLSAHSLEDQGNFWSYDFGLTNLSGDYFSPRGLEYYGSMNLLKSGILFAESVILPGARFANEAQTPTYGCGLDPVLRESAGKLEGIFRGLDIESWNPATDKAVPKPYKTAAGKSANQKAWQTKTGLAAGGLQLLAVTDAMTDDGMATLLPALDRIVESGARLAVLGRVSPANLAAMEFAKRRHAGEVAWLPDADEDTLRLALAASDALICAAPVAPDAEILRRAVRYGTLPICLGCGGLSAIAPAFPNGFAFPFYSPRPEALVDAVRHAASVHHAGAPWGHAVDRAMAADFSWSASAAATEALYAWLLARSGFSRAA